MPNPSISQPMVDLVPGLSPVQTFLLAVAVMVALATLCYFIGLALDRVLPAWLMEPPDAHDDAPVDLEAARRARLDRAVESTLVPIRPNGHVAQNGGQR